MACRIRGCGGSVKPALQHRCARVPTRGSRRSGAPSAPRLWIPTARWRSAPPPCPLRWRGSLSRFSRYRSLSANGTVRSASLTPGSASKYRTSAGATTVCIYTGVAVGESAGSGTEWGRSVRAGSSIDGRMAVKRPVRAGLGRGTRLLLATWRRQFRVICATGARAAISCEDRTPVEPEHRSESRRGRFKRASIATQDKGSWTQAWMRRNT